MYTCVLGREGVGRVRFTGATRPTPNVIGRHSRSTVRTEQTTRVRARAGRRKRLVMRFVNVASEGSVGKYYTDSIEFLYVDWLVNFRGFPIRPMFFGRERGYGIDRK